MDQTNSKNISLTINKEDFKNINVEFRQNLADFLREQGFNGTHLGCEQGACGACNVLLDGKSIRSCLTLAVQASGKEVTTVEGLNSLEMKTVKDCFIKNNAMQCGFCSSGMLMTTYEIIKLNKKLSRAEIREMISGNYCRCTGYQAIVDAIEDSVNKLNLGSKNG